MRAEHAVGHNDPCCPMWWFSGNQTLDSGSCEYDLAEEAQQNDREHQDEPDRCGKGSSPATAKRELAPWRTRCKCDLKDRDDTGGGGKEQSCLLRSHPCCDECCSATPNVRAKRAPAAGRQARAGENVPCTTSPGLVACRWRSA